MQISNVKLNTFALDTQKEMSLTGRPAPTPLRRRTAENPEKLVNATGERDSNNNKNEVPGADAHFFARLSKLQEKKL